MTYESFISIIKESSLSDWLHYDDEYISKNDLNVMIQYHMYSEMENEGEIRSKYDNFLSVSEISASYCMSLIALSKVVTVGTEDDFKVIPMDNTDELTVAIAEFLSRS